MAIMHSSYKLQHAYSVKDQILADLKAAVIQQV